MVFVVKRGIPGQHFENEDAQRVPVNGPSVAFRLNNFRCKIIGRTTQLRWTRSIDGSMSDESRHYRPRDVFDPLREAKVGDFDVSRRIKKNVLRLQIPIHDVSSVKVLESEHNFRGVETGNMVRKALAKRHLARHYPSPSAIKCPKPTPLRLRYEKSSPPGTYSITM